MWTVLALLLMVILGGFISYYGDLQGRRWGKKRVSWWGLRPKHTAILITSLTGALIALMSILTLLLISPTVRDVILSGERAIRDNKRLNRELQEQTRLDKIESAVSSKQKRLAAEELAQTQAQSARTLAQLTEMNARLKPLLARVADLDQKVARLQRTRTSLLATKTILTHTNQTLTLTNRNLNFTNRQISRQNLNLTRRNLQLAQSSQKLNKNIIVLKSSNDALFHRNQYLQSEGAELTKANTILQNSNIMMIGQQKTLNESILALQEKNAALQTQLEQNRQDLEQVYGRLVENQQAFTVNYIAVRQGQICVRAGSELARRTLDSHLRPEAVKAQLQQLLEEANRTATNYGARPDENGRAISIIRKQAATLVGAQNADEEKTLESVAKTLAGSDHPVVVVVRAFSNTLLGEQAPVDLNWQTVSRSFTPGQILASRLIDGSRPEAEVQQSIAQFLQTDVRNAAIKAGIIPQVDPSTGVSQIGQFDPFDLVRLVQQARRLHSETLLRAVAIASITSADPLDRQRLRLELVRPPQAER